MGWWKVWLTGMGSYDCATRSLKRLVFLPKLFGWAFLWLFTFNCVLPSCARKSLKDIIPAEGKGGGSIIELESDTVWGVI